MIRIFPEVCERRPNARFGLDMREVWGRSLKLSSIRRSSSTNEKGLCRRRLWDQGREIDRATRMPERKPALNRIKHNQGSYCKIPSRYTHLDSVRGTFPPGKTHISLGTAQSRCFSCGQNHGERRRPFSRPRGRVVV